MPHRTSLKVVLLLGTGFVTIASLIHSTRAVDRKVWVTSTFLDFTDGTLADGGVNTYVAADGSVRLVNLWDLNNDGDLDVVLASTHDNNEKVDLYIYWSKGGFSPARRTRLPTDGGKRAAVADLNADGWPDLIVANNFNGTKTELNSYVYWGGPQGFDSQRRSELPTQGAEAVAVADLNRDGYPEIVFANSGLTYHVAEDHFNQSYIYWGSKEGYSEQRRTSLRTVNGRDVRVADLNSDGFPDIVFANEGNTEAESGAMVYWGSSQGEYSEKHCTHLPGERSSAVAVADLNGDGHREIILANAFRLRARELGIYNIIETAAVDSYIYWGSTGGYSADRRTALPTVAARAVAVGDLDRNGRPDIVFANGAGGASYIYWNGPEGFQSYRRSALSTLETSDCAAEDLNGDGRLDLIFANRGDGRSRQVNSYIYWGSSESFSTAPRTELPTVGATGIGVADLNGDGEKDVVFINKEDGTAGAPTDSYIYWGDDRGQFSAGRRQAFPTRGPNSYATADFNNDGYVDLFMPETESVIYWGSAQGYTPANKQVLAERFAFLGRIADFNRDGYLDLALSEWSPGNEETSLYYGGPGGFSEANRFVFRIRGIRDQTIADLNRDGWLDIIYPATDGQLVIYWNSSHGFDNGRKTVLPCGAASAAEVADLNGDGYLDVIVANLWDPHPAPGKPLSFGGSPEAGTYIYWGNAQGYSESRRAVLPSVGNADVAVADLNGDGFLDLVLSSYHAGYTRSHPSYIYWNGPRGFDPARVTMLPTNSASGVLVADFNRDGYKDLFFVCHSKDGNHRNDSFLYWGSAEGYSAARRSLLPGLGPHQLTDVDIGDIYERSDRYDYTSPPFEGGPGARFERISWEGETLFRTSLEFQVRTAATREGLAMAPWQGPDGPKSFYRQPGSKLVGLDPGGRWIQYKASLVSPGSANSPVLHSVSIEYQ